MKYIKQFWIILLFSLLGELCRHWIPYPIPASIYGIILLFAGLRCRIIRLEQVKESGGFLVSILPVLFVAPTVALMEHWPLLKDNLLSLTVVVAATTVIVFFASGKVTELLMKRRDRHD